ncbi:MAG: hypothetical protein JO303_18420 [Caulobacteraceae bacterium]|nr:hypothetical protein [Caulobacteraceae bacterium]
MHVVPIADHPRVDPAKPLLIVDVDEVLALFFHGFAQFVEHHGFEVRMQRFALFQNIYRSGESEHLEIEQGRALLSDFFRTESEAIDPAPDAAHSLRYLAHSGAEVVILTNAPAHSREPRGRWLARHGMDYPMIINEGPKGPAVAALAAQTGGPVAFVDDLIGNLDSAIETAPQVHTFQMVADTRLRPIAPTAPERHRRIDLWPELRDVLLETLGLNPP